jgi:hypothetical protein
MERVLSYARTGKPRGRIASGLALLCALYVGSYLCFRAAHQIRCYGNASNRHPEKWSPEHGMDANPQLSVVYAPLMSLEGSLRTAAARLAG